MIIIGIALALGLLFVAAMPQRCMRQRKATRFEFALLVLMMVTVTPLSFGYFFSWLMLPFAAVTQTSARRKRRDPAVVERAGIDVTRSGLAISTRGAALRKYMFCHAAAICQILD